MGRYVQVRPKHPVRRWIIGKLEGPRTGARGFAVKFYDILSHESSDIITWTKSGLAFQVVDYTRFSEEILQKYFRHNKFSSFRRQLNLYGYRKVIKGPDAGAYMHPSFQRGRPDLLCEVKKGKVPHYDMHGLNEIHGQHFRHHPPSAKKGNAPAGGRDQTPPVNMKAVQSRQSHAVTPEIHGDMYVPPTGPLPATHDTPGTQAMAAISNMSLDAMQSPPPWAQPSHTMDALTLTPAWGGAVEDASPDGESLKERAAGVKGGGSGASGSGGSSSSSVPMAYWAKQRRRRTMSAQLVFKNDLPPDTEPIVPFDPNLCDVMDVICQCMEVRSSTDDSVMSGGSFKMDCTRRSSVSDLLSSISWESALRTTGTPGRASLAGTMDAVMAQEEADGGSGPRFVGGPTNSNSSTPPPSCLPPLEQQPSFDPNSDLGDRSHVIGRTMASMPAVVADSPLSMATTHPSQQQQQQQQRQQEEEEPNQHPSLQNKPSFDPNRESNIAAGIRASEGSAQAVGRDMAVVRANVTPELYNGGNSRSQSSSLTRESSRESTVARIFKSVPHSAPAADGGAWEGGVNGEGERRWCNERNSSGNGIKAPAIVNWEVSRPQATTASGWGLPITSPRPGAQVSMSTNASTVKSSCTTAQEPELLSRPSFGRMASLSLLKEPAPSRRPTIHESHEVERLLADEGNRAAWTRVTDDPDSLLLAKSIGDFLG